MLQGFVLQFDPTPMNVPFMVLQRAGDVIMQRGPIGVTMQQAPISGGGRLQGLPRQVEPTPWNVPLTAAHPCSVSIVQKMPAEVVTQQAPKAPGGGCVGFTGENDSQSIGTMSIVLVAAVVSSDACDLTSLLSSDESFVDLLGGAETAWTVAKTKTARLQLTIPSSIHTRRDILRLQNVVLCPRLSAYDRTRGTYQHKRQDKLIIAWLQSGGHVFIHCGLIVEAAAAQWDYEPFAPRLRVELPFFCAVPRSTPGATMGNQQTAVL